MTEAIVSGLVLLGSAFVFLAAIGVARMPDLYMRLSTVTKASTLGLTLLLVATVVELGTPGAVLKALTVIAFGFITSPVAAHMISRAAYFQGVRLWEGSLIDEMRGQYDAAHELASPEPADMLAANEESLKP